MKKVSFLESYEFSRTDSVEVREGTHKNSAIYLLVAETMWPTPSLNSLPVGTYKNMQWL